MRVAAALLAIAALSWPSTVAAQVTAPFDPSGGGGSIEGRVTIEQGSGLADVLITVLDQGHRAVSDVVGRFSLEAVDAGTVELRFERLGYATRTVTVEVQAGTLTRVDATMAPDAIELAPVDVTVGTLYLESNGFYRRSRRGFGLHFSRERLDELRLLEVSDAVRNLSGVRLRYDPYMANRVFAMSPRSRRFDGQGCALTVYIDGVRTLDPNLNQVPPDWLVAMEVYLEADTPVKFRTANSCGAVLLWTKRRGR